MTTKLISREPTDAMVEALRFANDDTHCSDYEALRRVFDAAPSLNPWVSVNKLPQSELGEMLLLTGGGWRHPFYGQVCDRDTGLCVLDSPTPQHEVPDCCATLYWNESIMSIPRPEE